MHYYQFNIADWVLHTSHLTVEEEGVYRRLLDHYYDTEEPIPEKTQSVIRRLRLGSYEETVGLILSEFFVLNDGFWHNLRADQEIEAYNSRAKTARENGQKGGRPKKQKHKKQQVTENENPEETQSVLSGLENKTQQKPNYKPETKNQIDICDYSVVIAAYREVLVSEGRPNILDARFSGSVTQSQIKARWKEHPNHQTKEFWEGFFNVVKLNDFWMGKGSWAKGVNLEWLTKRANFDKVLEQWNEAVENG